MDLGKRADHAAVSFVGHREDSSGLRDRYVRAGYAHVGMGEFVSHDFTGCLYLFRDDRLVLYLCVVSEQVRDLLFVQVQGGHDHVHGGVALERDDKFAQVGLLDQYAVVAQDLVHMNLFRRHRFGFHDGLNALLLNQIADEFDRLFSAGCVEDMSSARCAVLCELLDHLIDMIGGISLDPADLFAGLFKIHAFVGFEPSLGICLAERTKRPAKRFIIESRLDFLLQSFICHSAASFPSVDPLSFTHP